jgi:hypothetical protein
LQWRSACHSTIDATVDRIGLGACTAAAAAVTAVALDRSQVPARATNSSRRQARQLQCNAGWHALAHAGTARSQRPSVQFSCALTRALGVAYSVAAPVHLTAFGSSSDRDAPRRHGIRRHGWDHSTQVCAAALAACGCVAPSACVALCRSILIRS